MPASDDGGSVMSVAAQAPCDVGVIRGAPETPGCASHAKTWVLAVTVLGSSVAFLEASVINVALPAIQSSLAAGIGAVQWIASVYTLVLASLTLAGGSAGDRFGRRGVFILGLAVFTVACIGCSAARGATELIAGRALQGVGAAMLVPNSLALLSSAFPRAERGRAIGTWSAFTALTGAAGPLVGGWIVDAASWRAMFLLAVPLALVALAIAILRIPEPPHVRRPPDIDWRGALLVTISLALITYGIIGAAGPHRGDRVPLVTIVAGLAAFAAFVAVERRARAPLVPLALFRSRSFTGTNVMTLILYFALSGVFFLVPFDLVGAQGYSGTATGAAYLPFALSMAVLSRTTGTLSDRIGTRLALAAGSLVTAAGFALFARAGIGGSYWTTFFPPMLTVGIGMAVVVPPLTNAVMASVSASQAGVASGVNNTVARIAGLFAVAIVGLLALRFFAGALAHHMALAQVRPDLAAATLRDLDSLIDVRIPAAATVTEAAALRDLTRRAFVDAFAWIALGAAALSLASGAIAATLIERVPGAADADRDEPRCAHVEAIRAVEPRHQVCEECVRTGSSWVHLRVCLTCGHVGCCDSSVNHHAVRHFWSTQHPIVGSLQPGETWRWCYVDDLSV